MDAKNITDLFDKYEKEGYDYVSLRINTYDQKNPTVSVAVRFRPFTEVRPNGTVAAEHVRTDTEAFGSMLILSKWEREGDPYKKTYLPPFSALAVDRIKSVIPYRYDSPQEKK